jgi:carboxymethylenebutenolidase
MGKTVKNTALAALFVALSLQTSARAQNIDKTSTTAADTAVGRTLEAPVNRLPTDQKFWWNDDWYENGQLPGINNYQVVEREVAYTNPVDGTEVPAVVFRPKKPGKYPAILFQHGRRGFDELVRRLPRRLAARGFVVLAPDVYTARFIDKFPLEHMEETEGDTNAGVDFLLSLPDISTRKACLYSHTRGGFYTLKTAVKFNRQEKDIACYVSFYPHWVNPNKPEPVQVYRYDSDADKLKIPTMIFIGEFDQYQRRRSIETAVKSMKALGRDVKLVIYPGVGRGFDFRPPSVRTFADDLATQDSNRRMAAFFRKHLKPWVKN